MYILIQEDENVIYLNGNITMKDEYNLMLNDMGYKNIEINPLFIITIILICVFTFGVLFFIYWKIFVKAGVPGWYAIVPILNIYYIYKIAFGRGIYFLTIFIPLVA